MAYQYEVFEMNYYIDIQHACHDPLPISNEILTHWAITTLKPHCEKAELTLRFVDLAEITELNHTYRKQNKATNVLAFPASHPDELPLDYPLLGDVIVCPTVLQDESQSLKTNLDAHWAHIIIHGILHLLGYDHIIETDAEKMRSLEITLLSSLGFDNPYKDNTFE